VRGRGHGMVLLYDFVLYVYRFLPVARPLSPRARRPRGSMRRTDSVGLGVDENAANDILSRECEGSSP
jgi:hypothetical protein